VVFHLSSRHCQYVQLNDCEFLKYCRMMTQSKFTLSYFILVNDCTQSIFYRVLFFLNWFGDVVSITSKTVVILKEKYCLLLFSSVCNIITTRRFIELSLLSISLVQIDFIVVLFIKPKNYIAIT
jgi:hypothetical protein